jgi:tetratricopeptide (TPR) repeat protein
MSIPAYQRLGNARGLAETHHNLAITFRDLRDWQSAEEHERRALEYARQAADARTEAIALSGLADLQLQWGDAPLAEATAGFAAREFARLGDAKGEADSLRLVGVAALAQRKDVAAREALARAVALASERGFALIEAEARRARAELALASNDVPSARTESERALAIFERLAASAEAESLRQWIGSLPR